MLPPRFVYRPLVSNLYRTARLANDVSAIASGNPHRIAQSNRQKPRRASARPTILFFARRR